VAKIERIAGLLVAAAALVHGEAARAGEVIVHPSLELRASQVRDVFLGEKQIASGVPIVPVDNSAAQEKFLAAVLQTNERSYGARWRHKAFREGLHAPAVKGSDAEVMSFVRSTPGAVGYLAGEAGPGVRVIDRF
jgi:hypothetical protein